MEKNNQKVLYEEMRPDELLERVQTCPVAYLPLGTLEWHGAHMPLGADGLQSKGLFMRMAQKMGGVVLPMLFMGPDTKTVTNQGELYGMDVCGDHFVGNMKYESRQLCGSCYHVEDEVYKAYLMEICKQVARGGFKVLLAHGHGPSVWHFQKIYAEVEQKYHLKCLDAFNPEENYYLGMQVDHGGANETSIMQAVRPELVDMDKLPSDMAVWPLAIGMGDPRIHASKEMGDKILAYQEERLINKIKTML